jgi:hypothetical protein
VGKAFRPPQLPSDTIGGLSSAPDERPNPPWLFGLLPLPFTFAYAAASTVLSFLLRQHNVPVERIATIIAITSLPNVWGFALAPIVDLGLRRRSWCSSATSPSACAPPPRSS